MCEKKRTRFWSQMMLAFAALTLVLVILSFDRGVAVMMNYTCPLIFAFAGMALFSGRYRGQMDLWVGVAFVGWYVLSRILLGELYLEYSQSMFSNLCCAYLLALPFAHAADDRQGKQGLQIVSTVFGVGYGLLAWIGVLTALLGMDIVLPYLGTRIGMNVLPGERRLRAGNHPNISACVFLIALMLIVWLLAQKRRRWLIPCAVIAFAGLYTGIALTVSRTVMLQTGCFAAGIVFLALQRLPIRQMWKKTLLGLLAGAACLVLVFVSFGWVADGVTVLSNQLTAHAETVKEAVVAERSLFDDLTTMTGRTDIFGGVMQLIKDDPKVLLTGILNSELVSVMHRYVGNEHAHNSYLQTLLNMGLPGLLMAVFFTVRAVWVSVKLIFSRKAAFADQLLAVILLVFLVGTIPEPYLFSEYLTAANMPFFLVLGYALETERGLRA